MGHRGRGPPRGASSLSRRRRESNESSESTESSESFESSESERGPPPKPLERKKERKKQFERGKQEASCNCLTPTDSVDAPLGAARWGHACWKEGSFMPSSRRRASGPEQRTRKKQNTTKRTNERKNWLTWTRPWGAACSRPKSVGGSHVTDTQLPLKTQKLKRKRKRRWFDGLALALGMNLKGCWAQWALFHQPPQQRGGAPSAQGVTPPIPQERKKDGEREGEREREMVPSKGH